MYAVSDSVNSHLGQYVSLEGRVFLMSSLTSGFYILSDSFPYRILWALGQGFDGGIPFRAKCSKVTLSMCVVSGYGYLYLFFVLQEEVCLKIAKQVPLRIAEYSFPYILELPTLRFQVTKAVSDMG